MPFFDGAADLQERTGARSPSGRRGPTPSSRTACRSSPRPLERATRCTSQAFYYLGVTLEQYRSYADAVVVVVVVVFVPWRESGDMICRYHGLVLVFAGMQRLPAPSSSSPSLRSHGAPRLYVTTRLSKCSTCLGTRDDAKGLFCHRPARVYCLTDDAAVPASSLVLINVWLSSGGSLSLIHI